MANSTLTPNSREEQDTYGDPTQSRHTLQKAEQSVTNPYVGAGIDQAEAFANDSQNAVKRREEIPYENTSKNRSSKSSPLSLPNNPITALNVAKKGGPIALIISIIFGGGALFFGSFSLLPVHIYENFLSKYDSSNTSYTLRTNKMLVNKLTKKATDGDCSFTGILCRFRRPSNFMLKQLAASGIEPLDANKQVISKNLLLPNNRPSNYRFTDSSGNTHIVSAADLKTTLNSNEDFRAAFHNALKTRLQVFSDSVFKSVAAKFGFSKEDTTKSATTDAEVNDTIDREVAGETKNSASDVEDVLKTTAKGETDKLGKSGMGNEIGQVAGAICLVGDVPGIIQHTARAYQMAQLIRFASIFMTTVSALKAGDATQQEVSALGNNLTQVSGGGSALDSYGMRYTLYGDTSPGNDTHYQSFVPGGAATAVLGGITLAMNSTQKKDICSVAASPVTGAAIDAAACPETACIAPLINAALGTATALGIIVAGPILIDFIAGLIPPPVYAAIAKAAFGDITANLSGENYGDALSSGAANSLGQLANAGGNVPLSVDQAVAYNNQTQAVNLAYAQEDRATLSPLDASNNNTLAGAFFEKLIPLYSQMGSLTSFASSLASLAGATTSGLLMGNSYAAANNTTQYKQCSDPALTSADGSQTAAGPFCNIEYGIPTQYLDMDPQAIVTDLVNGGQIDPNTGEALDSAPLYKIAGDVGAALGIPPGNPITNYYTWLQTCTDGATDQANNCQIKDKQTAEYALYTIDHRIQKNMDNQDTQPTGSNTATADTNTSNSIPNTCSNIKASGADINDIGSLSGNTLTQKLGSAGNKGVAFDSNTYTFNDFAANSSGFTSSNSGLYGMSTASTIFEMTPRSSTKAGQIPGQDSLSTTPQAHTNQFYLARLSGAGMHLNCFTVKGTDQGHLYNGVMLDHVSGAQVSNIMLDNAAPGDSNSPPGETFAWNDFHGNNNTYKNIEINGNNDGAAGFGNNSTNGGTWINSYVHDQKYSAAWTLWQQTGGAIFQDCIAKNSEDAINLERVTGTIEVDNFTFDGNNHDFNIGNDQSGDLKVIIKDPIIKGRDKLIINIGSKMQGVTNLDKRSDVQVLVNGINKTSDLVTFTGGGA